MIPECLVVEFRVTGDDCPLADASEVASGAIDAAPPLLRADDYALLRFSTSDDSVGDVLDGDERIRYLHRTAADGVHTYRCLSKQRCAVHRLIDVGFLVESIRYQRGAERHVGAVVGQEVLQGVLEAAGETVGVELARISPLGNDGETTVESRWNLTPAQADALETAYQMGYYEIPRAASSEEVAAALGISKSAFLERLRRAQAGLLEQELS